MKVEAIKEVEEELKRFSKALSAFKQSGDYKHLVEHGWTYHSKLSGKVKRASLDLSQALVKLRKP